MNTKTHAYTEAAGAIYRQDVSTSSDGADLTRGTLIAEAPTNNGQNSASKREALRILVDRANAYAAQSARIAELEGALRQVLDAHDADERTGSSVFAAAYNRARALLAKKEG